MIVEIVHINRMTISEAKGHTPISRDRHRIVTFEPPFKTVQLEAWQVHAFWPGAVVQCGQDTLEFCDMARCDLGRAFTLIKRLQAAVAK